MAPVEDLASRDLAWISDFVMQQMVIMMRPMMDHLQETDAAADYAHRMVQRLSMDVTELRGDLERTNKYLAILRQGLGVQNEGKCVLQRSADGTTRTVKRLDDQMENMLSVMRSLEDSLGTLGQEARGDRDRQEELAKQVSTSGQRVDDLHSKIERISIEAHTLKDDLLSNEARMEVWQKELREMRRGHLGVVTKMDEKTVRPPPSSQSCRAATAAEQVPWPQKKSFAASVEPLGKGGEAPGGFAAVSGLGETNSNHSGSSQQSKRVSRIGSSSQGIHLPPDCDERGGSLGGGLRGAKDEHDEHGGAGSRLPLLTAGRQPSCTSRAAERSGSDSAPRLRFTATMAKPESRGKSGSPAL